MNQSVFRQFLENNISLTITKMIEDFSTQLSLSYFTSRVSKNLKSLCIHSGEIYTYIYICSLFENFCLLIWRFLNQNRRRSTKVPIRRSHLFCWVLFYGVAAVKINRESYMWERVFMWDIHIIHVRDVRWPLRPWFGCARNTLSLHRVLCLTRTSDRAFL